MSAIAEVLVRMGHSVSGSDLKAGPTTDRLASLGVRIHVGHDAPHLGDADLVVYSSAVRPDNPEIREARRRGLPVISRGEALAELMSNRFGIAIAGAHGKTTTTSMIALTLDRAGLDPTAVIGGRLAAFGGNARFGRGKYFIAESDESDRSFLRLSPVVAVITNIDREHLESYKSFNDLKLAFVEFANRVPPHGVVIACADDVNLREAVSLMNSRVITYGLEAPDADIAGQSLELGPHGSRCRVWLRPQADSGSGGASGQGYELGTLALNVPGRHNAQNALAAIAVGRELEVPFERMASALAEFRGAERRFERRGEAGGVVVIDDYGHHPTEIAALVDTARRAAAGRVLVVFQPHRYSRTRQLLDQFGPALAGADLIALTDIYGAGEDPIPGVTIDRLAEAVRATVAVPVHVLKTLEEIPPAIARLARPGDMVVTLGAGSIGAVGDKILEELGRQRGREAIREG